MPKYLPVFDNTKEIEQEESTFDPKALKAAGISALNQFNLFSNIGGAGNTLIGNKLDKSISDEDWENKSLYEKYQANKDIIQKKVNELEDEYPKASLTGNIAGGIVPALFTGGASLTGTAAKTGAKLLPKVTSTASKLSPNKLKLAGQVADSSLIAGTDSAMFERDPDKKGEAFLRGAGIGAVLPLGIASGKNLLTKGDNPKKYIERIPEILEQRKAGKKPVTDLQDKVKAKIEITQPSLDNDAKTLSASIKETVLDSSNQHQVNEINLLDQIKEAKGNLQNTISKESSGGYELLDATKKIKTKDIDDVLDSYIKKTDMLSDVSAPLLKKYKDRLSTYNGEISEVDLKKLINAMRGESEQILSQSQKGSYVPKGVRAIKKAAAVGDDILKESNVKYRDYMKPLADKTQKAVNIDKILKLDKNNEGNTLKVLKNYKKDIKTQKALADLQDQTGIDFRPQIDEIVNSDSIITSLSKESEDKLATALKSGSKTSEYQDLLDKVARYKKQTGVDLRPQVDDLRLKYQVDLLERAKELTKPSEKGFTPFQKSVGNLNVEDYDPKNVFERITGEDIPSDIKPTQAKSNKARKDIEDLSSFLGEDVGRNTKDIEAASLYDWMGSGKTNGSRNVNLGAITGSGIGALAGSLKGSFGGPLGTGIGGVLGAVGGALKDTGIAQRTRREILNTLYNPANAKRNDVINRITRFEGATTLPSEIQKQENRENQALSTFEDYYKSNRIGDLVDRQQKINEDVFGRSN